MKELNPMEIENMEDEMMELPENLDELIDLAEWCELDEDPGGLYRGRYTASGVPLY